MNLDDHDDFTAKKHDIDMPLVNVDCCGSVHLDVKFDVANNVTVFLKSASNLTAVDFGGLQILSNRFVVIAE